MEHKFRLLLLAVCISYLSFSQSKINQFLEVSDTLNVKRKNAVILTETVIGTATLIGLNSIWYKDYPRSSFHTINDLNEWEKMDKFGHVFTSYQLGSIGADLLHWSGVDKKRQLIYGTTLGFTFLTAVEILDGYSQEWGFSWSDVGANALGTGLYLGQELLWKEQRIQIKFSFHQTKYALERPGKLGNSFLEQVLKDYNGQTYWLSANLHSFFKEYKLPKWLNFAVGYGAKGMLTGENEDVNNMFTKHDRYQQIFLSFDLNLNNIKTESNVLRTIFSVLNVIKIPLPTLEINSKKEVVFHLMLL